MRSRIVSARRRTPKSSPLHTWPKQALWHLDSGHRLAPTEIGRRGRIHRLAETPVEEPDMAIAAFTDALRDPALALSFARRGRLSRPSRPGSQRASPHIKELVVT